MKAIAICKNQLSQEGGLEKYTMQIAKGFAKKGCQVTLITAECSPFFLSEALSQAIAVAHMPTKLPTTFLQLLEYDCHCQRWCRENRYDVVLGMDRTTQQTHYRAGNGVHVAYLQRRQKTDSWLKQLSFPINPLHRTLLSLEKKAYQNSQLKKIFTNSRLVKEEILHHYSVDAGKIQVIHNGVEWKEKEQLFARWPEERERFSQALGLDRSSLQLLFIGKGFRRKGLHWLLHALATLKERNFQLSIVGQDKEMKSFMQLAKKLSLEKQIFFWGHRRDVFSFYCACDLLVIPTSYDPFANVTIEALSMGLFVISSKENGAAEILQPTTGKVVEEFFDVDALASALREAFQRAKTPQQAELIRHSVEQFDFSNQIRQLITTTLECQ